MCCRTGNLVNVFCLPFYSFLLSYLLYLFLFDRKRFLEIFSLLTLSHALSENLKLIFQIRRHHFLSPFSYPSSHSSVSTSLFFFLSKKLLLIYFPIYLLNLYGRIWIGAHDFLDIIGGILTAFLSFYFFRFLKKFDGLRKTLHMFLGTLLYLISLHFFNYLTLVLLLLSIIGFFLVFISEKVRIPVIEDFLEFYGHGKYRGFCAFAFVLGCFLSSIFGKEAFIFGILNLIWVDTGAFLFGKLFGTKNKSFYGLLGAYLFLLIPCIQMRSFSIFYLLIPLFELLSPFDNVTIPFFSAFLFWKTF